MKTLIIAVVVFSMVGVGVCGDTVTKDDVYEWANASDGTFTSKTCFNTFDPQPDITSYELALCLKFYLENNNSWCCGLPDTIKRHIREDCYED